MDGWMNGRMVQEKARHGGCASPTLVCLFKRADYGRRSWVNAYLYGIKLKGVFSSFNLSPFPPRFFKLHTCQVIDITLMIQWNAKMQWRMRIHMGVCYSIYRASGIEIKLYVISISLHLLLFFTSSLFSIYWIVIKVQIISTRYLNEV